MIAAASRRRGSAALRGAAGAALLFGLAAPAETEPESRGIEVRATVTPAVARLGEPVTYRGRVVFPRQLSFKWLPPEGGEAFTWGDFSPRRVSGRSEGGAEVRDTLFVDVRLQVFETGVVPIPGLRFQNQDSARATVYRLPTVRLEVASVLAAADSNADLRPVRGPMGAPWWERVPWTWVFVGVLALAGLAAGLVAWRRRRKPVPAAVPLAPDPVAEALAALAALRGLNLPTHGRFAEHASTLSRITRRFLEATARTPRPGDTTPELLEHLQSVYLDPEDLLALRGLLRMWDRVKFARAPSSREEAKRAEDAVETLVRRHAPAPPSERVA